MLVSTGDEQRSKVVLEECVKSFLNKPQDFYIRVLKKQITISPKLTTYSQPIFPSVQITNVGKLISCIENRLLHIGARNTLIIEQDIKKVSVESTERMVLISESITQHITKSKLSAPSIHIRNCLMSFCKLSTNILCIDSNNLSVLYENDLGCATQIEICITSNTDFLHLLLELNKIKNPHVKIILIDNQTISPLYLAEYHENFGFKLMQNNLDYSWISEDTSEAWKRLPKEYKC